MLTTTTTMLVVLALAWVFFFGSGEQFDVQCQHSVCLLAVVIVWICRCLSSLQAAIEDTVGADGVPEVVEVLQATLNDASVLAAVLEADGPGSADLQAGMLLVWIMDELAIISDDTVARLPQWDLPDENITRGLDTLYTRLTQNLRIEVRCGGASAHW